MGQRNQRPRPDVCELHIRSLATHSSFPVTIVLQREQLKVKGSFGEPDERDGDHGQRSAREDQAGVEPGMAVSGSVSPVADGDRLLQEEDQSLKSLLVMSTTAVPQS